MTMPTSPWSWRHCCTSMECSQLRRPSLLYKQQQAGAAGWGPADAWWQLVLLKLLRRQSGQQWLSAGQGQQLQVAVGFTQLQGLAGSCSRLACMTSLRAAGQGSRAGMSQRGSSRQTSSSIGPPPAPLHPPG